MITKMMLLSGNQDDDDNVVSDDDDSGYTRYDSSNSCINLKVSHEISKEW